MNSTRIDLSQLKQSINNYLNTYKILCENRPWELRISSLGEYGIFATRNINVGEIVFKDRAIFLGPRFFEQSQYCVCCFQENITDYCKSCYLLICECCNDNFAHKKECELIQNLVKSCSKVVDDDFKRKLFKCLCPLRSLLINGEEKNVVKCLKGHRAAQHGFEVDILKNELNFQFSIEDEQFMRQSCRAMDTNGFQLDAGDYGNEIGLRGLYPLASLANHSCIPNISHVFDENQLMIARAAVFIPKDTELFHSYTRVTWGTSTRLYHLLKTKHFICKCKRCLDPTEFGTYMNSVLCKSCKGKIIPVNPLKPKGKWQCEDCKQLTQGKEVEHLLTLLSSVLKGFSENTDLEIMVKYLNGRLRFMAPPNSQVAIEVKLKIIWMLGYDEKYKWHCLNTDQLILKKNLCIDIIELLEKLKTGQCKMRGLLLYELFCTEKELSKKDLKEQNNNITNMQIAKTYLEEASNILLYDVTAPQEIKEKWKTIL